LYSCTPGLSDCADLPEVGSCAIASWLDFFLLRVFHRTNISAAITIAPPTAIPAIAPVPSGDDFVELLVEAEGEVVLEELSDEELDFDGLAVVVGLMICVVCEVPEETVVAPGWGIC